MVDGTASRPIFTNRRDSGGRRTNSPSRIDWRHVLIPSANTPRLSEVVRTLAKGSNVMVQGPVRTCEFERDAVRQRITEVRADSVGKVDRANRVTNINTNRDP